MRKILMLLAALAIVSSAAAKEPSVEGFSECANQWIAEHGNKYERFKPTQFRQIADNIIAYQNEDGGWPRNIDVLAVLNPDSIRKCIGTERLRSTFDNMNVCPQIEYLATVFFLTGDSVYCHSAQRGMEYVLGAQAPNGNWHGWDTDEVLFGDRIVTSIMGMWLGVLQAEPIYAWVADPLKAHVQDSWNRGLALILKCQCESDGVKTIWAEEYDPKTLQPVHKPGTAISALAPGTSEQIVFLLMRIRQPMPEIVGSVKAAAAWFEKQAVEQEKSVSVAEFQDTPGGRVLKQYPEWLRKVVGRIGKKELY